MSVIVEALLSIGDAIGVAKSHGMLRGDVEGYIVQAGELAFKHLAEVFPGDLMAMIATYIEGEIAKDRNARGLPRKALSR